VASGVWDLKPSRHEGGGMRWVRLEKYLNELIGVWRGPAPFRLGYEEVRRHAGTDAAHIYGGVVATIQRICEGKQMPYLGLPVGTVKKLATGKGNAGKPEMIQAATAHWPLVTVRDDNEADALWIAEVLRQSC
jgi:Holliday junction resolvasome RuvABC endonuclease subunit